MTFYAYLLAGALYVGAGATIWWQHERIGDLTEARAICEGNMQSLIEAGDEALARSEKERDAARAAAATSRARAAAIIDAPQSVPGDACASAEKDVTEWLRGRR